MGLMSYRKSIIAALLSASVLLTIFVWYHFSLIDVIDEWWLSLMLGYENGTLISVMKILTYLGDTLLLYPLAIVISYFLYSSNSIFLVYRYLAAMVSSSIIVNILKFAIDRDRPLEGLLSLFSKSYPSGHTMLATVFYTATFYSLYKLNFLSRRKSIFFSLFFILLVGFTRTYLRVHYLSDVIGAMTIGLLLIFLFVVPYFDKGSFS